MSAKKDNATIVGVAAVACAACCAGPIIGFPAAIGLGTLAGVALFGVIGLAVAVIGIAVLAHRRKKPHTNECASTREPVAVARPTRR